MADSSDPHRATGAPPRRGNPRRRRAGEGRSVDPLLPPFVVVGSLQPASRTSRFGILRVDDDEDDPEPASPADVGAGTQASSYAASMMYGAAMGPGPDSPARRSRGRGRGRGIESGYRRVVGSPSHRRQSQASSSAAPSSDHPRARGAIRVRQSVLYSDRPRRSRPRGLARAEASVVRSSELPSPVMDLPTFEALSLSDPPLSTPQTAEMTDVDYARRSEQEEHTSEVNTSDFDRKVTEALSLSDPPLLTPQTETDEELTDDDCAWVPPIRQTKFIFNRPKGISRDMILSMPIFGTIPNVKDEGPELYSDIDPKDVQRMVKEYLDARPCINLDVAYDSFLVGDEEDPTINAHAAELGTEPKLPSVITEQASVAAAHPQHSMVPTESRHEASTEKIIRNGTAWMNEEVMLCFKKFVDKSQHLANLEDYHLHELQHQCFNVEGYDKVYHHYNFTVRMKMPKADWIVKLYFAEVKEVFGTKYYLCYPLDPNENGQCYACKNQGVEDLRHPAIDLFEIGSPDASCSLWYGDWDSDVEA